MKVAVPFGVFLGLAFLIVVFFGSDVFAAWVRLLTPGAS
jgi:hypothetical protein